MDPFDPDSPIKQCAIQQFPRDMFFVLRVVQLLRGLATGMGVTDFSCAKQWAPLAKEAVRRSKRERRGAGQRLLSAAAAPLKLAASGMRTVFWGIGGGGGAGGQASP